MSISYIPRVTQLDAVQLDEQVEDLLKQQLFQATKYLEPGILQPILPELDLLLRSLVFKYSVYDKKCTFGQQMLSLQYKKENFTNSKLLWYYICTIGLTYAKERGVYSFAANTKVQNFLNKVDNVQVLADILNFLNFIQTGRYPLLIDFILGLQLSAEKLTKENLTDFSWTRELLWNNFIELIGTSLSLLNIFGLQRKLTTVMKYLWWRRHVRTPATTSLPVMTINTVCACCSRNPVIPHTMGCSHIFCYYCLKANKMADEEFACPQCYYIGKDVQKFTVK